MESGQQLATQYRHLGDEELLRLWVDQDSLTDIARDALSAEVVRRGLVIDEGAQQQLQQHRETIQATAEKAKSRSIRVSRLGAFMTVGVIFGFLCPLTLGIDATREWMQLGFLAWLVSNIFAEETLTVKRTWLAAMILNVVVFLGLLGIILIR